MKKELLMQRHLLRDRVRLWRRALSPQQQIAASKQIVSRVMNDSHIHSSHTLALFLSFDGELDTQPLINVLWNLGKKVYLPVLHPFISGQLLFIRYTPTTPLVLNRLKIREPQLDITMLLPLDDLDILFTPLVAFDVYGKRIGMGGGFYDRLLQYWQLQKSFYPIGLAHDCQKVDDQLPLEKWDIGLPEIITPSRHWYWEVIPDKKILSTILLSIYIFTSIQ